jgi:hypothetical protein
MKVNEVVLGLYSIMREAIVACMASINLIGGIFTEMATLSLELEKEMNSSGENRVSVTDRRVNLIKKTFFLRKNTYILIPGNEMSSETKRTTFHKRCRFQCSSRKQKYFAVRKIRNAFREKFTKSHSSYPYCIPKCFQKCNQHADALKLYSCS